MKPGVTIVLPNWNHELVLPRAVKSALDSLRVLREAGVDGELLVVDDGSRDGSLTLLRQLEALYSGAGLRVIALKENAGLSGARNVALRVARFRYFLPLDADNELVRENLPLFYRALIETRAYGVTGNMLTDIRGDVRTMQNSFTLTRAFFVDYTFGFDTLGIYDRTQLVDSGYAETLLGQDDESNLHNVTNGRRYVFVPAVMGIYYTYALSLFREKSQERSDDPLQQHRRYRQRVFDQFGVRAHIPMQTEYLAYHPDLGYLDMDARSNL